jgi:outer membrane protein TolC
MRLSQFGGVKVIDQGPPDTIRGIGMTVAVSSSPTASAGPRLITLQEAQQKAAPADSNPMVRLGQLQVEVARQTRLGTQSSFFPQIGSAFDNLHFNKFMGEQLQVRRPIQGGTATIAVPLVGKDQTFVAVTATQPITPLFQLRELYKINLADERIARAKAGMPISETANKVEKAYYELLVAQRQLAFTASMAALFFESAKR